MTATRSTREGLDICWRFSHDLGLYFLVISQSVLKLGYLEEVVQNGMTLFRRMFHDRYQDLESFEEFTPKFKEMLHIIEEANVRKPSKSKKFGKKSVEEFSKNKGKKMREWEGKVSAKKMEELNFSQDRAESASSSHTSLSLKQMAEFDIKDVNNNRTANSGKLSSFFHGITKGKILTEEDLDQITHKLKENLIGKNVSTEVADKICSAASSALVGERIGTFESIGSKLKTEVEKYIVQILSPATHSDILNEIKKKKSTGNPYCITFIGVNGVGKSTNLSKICFWLLKHNFKVLIAACDTFRSGAVEQLKVHVRNLNELSTNIELQLFERGYGKDDAGIAEEAIKFGQKNGFDVVLVDTAGRMQGNEALMRSLAKLVSVNQPDKILFVGEALVGNDGIDQLVKFNRALKEHSDSPNPRQIDGIVLTKFDTIDDKVGAALSMTFTAQAPILFIGTGQTYTDLKSMNISSIVDCLLS